MSQPTDLIKPPASLLSHQQVDCCSCYLLLISQVHFQSGLFDFEVTFQAVCWGDHSSLHPLFKSIQKQMLQPHLPYYMSFLGSCELDW